MNTDVAKRRPTQRKLIRVDLDCAMFFTLDGKVLHQYHGIVPLSIVRLARGGVGDWFGSHGCVRLVEADARALFDWAPLPTAVHVV